MIRTRGTLYIKYFLASVLLLFLQISFATRLHWFSKFSKNMLPEGLVVCQRKLYVGIANTQKIYHVTSHGNLVYFGELPRLGKNKGVMTGLVCDAAGYIYAALDSKNRHIPSGVYRLPLIGGRAQIFAKSEYLMFPNGFVFDHLGNLYVSDSLSKSILKINKLGKVSRWSYGEIYAGNPRYCPQVGTEKIMGANGIAIDKENKHIYVTNTDKATLIEIPILKNGLAGNAKIIIGPNCDLLAGADGLYHYNGFFIIAINRQNKLLLVDKKTLKSRVLFQGDLLSFPATPVIIHDKAWSTVYVTNFSLLKAMRHTGRPTPGILYAELRVHGNV